MKTGYPSDLTRREWAKIQPYFPRQKRRGRKKIHSKKDIVNAIMYVLRTGCQWRALPNDFPPCKTVFGYFSHWKKNGLWEKINDKLRERVREKAGRKPEPSAAIIDSQSVKTGEVSDDKGFDGGKLIKGRKRNALVDVLGLLIVISVIAANIPERKEAESIFSKASEKTQRLKKIWADGGYTGELAQKAESKFGWDLEIIKPTKKEPGFHVRPWCWIVERTFGWISKSRRMSKDYERTTSSSEALIQCVMIRLIVKRLAFQT